MEDNIKIFKVEYLSNNWFDLPQTLNFSLRDHPNIEYYLKWRRLPMEDGLQILKVDYLSNYSSDLPDNWH